MFIVDMVLPLTAGLKSTIYTQISYHSEVKDNHFQYTLRADGVLCSPTPD